MQKVYFKIEENHGFSINIIAEKNNTELVAERSKTASSGL